MKTNLLQIPGVGIATKQSMNDLGITCVEDLKGKNPEDLYKQECEQKGVLIDRCQLYVYRCAVYYAETENPDPEKLKWWYWKD